MFDIVHALNLTDETETVKAETQKRDSAEVEMEDPIFITLEYYRSAQSVLFQFHSPFVYAGKTEAGISSDTILLILPSKLTYQEDICVVCKNLYDWDALASWLVRWAPDQVVQVWALAVDIVLCSWAQDTSLPQSLSPPRCINVYRLV